MAYGVRTPIIDGNIHRLFTRLMAVHAPQTAPQTIKFLWSAAEELVDSLPKDGKKGIAGDWNQVGTFVFFIGSSDGTGFDGTR
jgi:A/G-specific adenine glycosylase